MGNGNLARATLVLSLILGATTIIGGTAALIFRSESGSAEKKAESVEAKFDAFHKDEFQPLSTDFTSLKSQILTELKNIKDSQDETKALLRDHLKVNH